MLTGESMPVEKRPADDDKEAAGKVYGGTINAGPGVLFASYRSGRGVALASIVKLVEQAQGSKTQIEALADYVARNFVAGVVAVAVAAFALWFSPRRRRRCPGLVRRRGASSSPSSSASPCWSSRAPAPWGWRRRRRSWWARASARYGVLIKGGRPLEVAHKVSAVVFDKTGTLTRGQPDVSSVDVFATSAAQKASLAASLGVADDGDGDAADALLDAVGSNLGIEVWMLTGDNERTAQAIARQCGISRVLAKVRPDDKARNVTSLMDQGHVVAMVGDGVNDFAAPRPI
ncbi:cation-transporting ATPase [Aureococcus anophagefferens]|nr:cation-transporting ATPase [Aureococcus anophagefferens]